MKFTVRQFVKLEISCQCIGNALSDLRILHDSCIKVSAHHCIYRSIFIPINRVPVYQSLRRLVELSYKNWKCTFRSSVYVRSV